MSTADVNYEVGLNSKKFDKGQQKLDNQFRKMKISADQFGKSGVMALSTMALGAGGAVVAFKAFSEVIDLVNDALLTEDRDSMEQVKDQLDTYNNLTADEWW